MVSFRLVHVAKHIDELALGSIIIFTTNASEVLSLFTSLVVSLLIFKQGLTMLELA